MNRLALINFKTIKVLKNGSTISFLFKRNLHTSTSIFKPHKTKIETQNSTSGSSLASKCVNSLPKKLNAYARLSRMQAPIGTWLLFLPCAFSTALSGASISDQIYLNSIMLFGAFCMRGAGCILNDLADRKIDKFVERTKSRPLASGELTKNEAFKSLFCHVFGAVSTLPFLVNFGPAPLSDFTCFWLAVSSLPLVVMYPFSKRYTNYPQVVLGATFSWGAFMGMAAVMATTGNTLATSTFFSTLPITLPCYISCILWTLYYDTIYAFQDVVDDRTMGVKSLALTLLDQKNPTSNFGQINDNEIKTKFENLTDLEIKTQTEKANQILKIIGISSSLFMVTAMVQAEFDYSLISIWLASSSFSVWKTTKTNWMADPKICWEAFNNEKRKGFLLVGLLMFGPVVLKYFNPKDLDSEENSIRKNKLEICNVF